MRNSINTKIFGHESKHGSVLVITLLMVLLLIGLGAAVSRLITSEARIAEIDRQQTIALSIAESGMERCFSDLRLDFVNDTSSPSFSDGNISTYNIGPDTNNFYSVPYSSTTLNSGSYAVTIKNSASTDAIWVRSTGTYQSTSVTLQAYVKVTNASVWGNAIFAGTGASGAMVNGNVTISGSVHILGTGLSSTDYAIDLGGTAELVRNNYTGMDATILPKVPALPTVTFGGETVSTLSSKLRVKHGKVGLSGSSSVGEPNVAGNSTKETVDGAYVTDGYGGTSGTSSVYSDNGWSNGYDLGDSVSFPSLSTPYQSFATYQNYLQSNGFVPSAAQLAVISNITPTSSFSYSNANGSISMSGGNLNVTGIVYLNSDLNFNKAGSNKTITYTGTGSILVTGSTNINVNLITSGNNSFPSNQIAIMTPNSITFNEANINVMGLYYGETSVVAQKQTNIIGSIVSNYFDFGTNVPKIFQVPTSVNNLPPGLVGSSNGWSLSVVDWQKL